jgi:tetratricopeptide (TPR) repeat protein
MLIARPYILTRLVQLHLRQNQLDEAEALINQAKKGFNSESTPIFFQFIFLAEAELALRQGGYERALAVSDDLLASLNQFGMRAFIAEALHLRGQILVAMGQTEAAYKTLLQAQAEAEAVGSRRMLWQILFALSRLEADPAEAERQRKQAQEIVTSIAAHVSDPELRASFLGLAQVRAVLAPA